MDYEDHEIQEMLMEYISEDDVCQRAVKALHDRISALEAQVSALTADRARLVWLLHEIAGRPPIAEPTDGYEYCVWCHGEIFHGGHAPDCLFEATHALLAELAKGEAE